MKPIVAIVGRPNVGKSTIFNKLAGDRISIVEDYPGVTRDRILAESEWLGKYFTIIDTGGIEPNNEEIIFSKMRMQAQLAIDMAHVILFVVDAKVGITPQDHDIAVMLRKSDKPIIVVANKVDNREVPDSFYSLYELGIGEMFAISGVNGLGFGDLLDEVISHFPENLNTEKEEDLIKVAIVGKPNAGKSSIVNKLLGEERVIVSNIAGTTRDAIDTYKKINGQKYLFIDTAGIRRKNKIDENIEKYSVIRSYAAIERSDVVLLVIDANEGITEQDSKIAGLAHDKGKCVVVVVNKWDLPEKNDKTMDEYIKSIRMELPFMMYAPIIFISTLTGQRFGQILENINYVYNQASKRVSTGILNDVIGEAIMLNQPPSDKGKRLKIYYATQVGIKPPMFTIFVNNMELFHFSYQRYLENRIRESFGFEGTPIVFKQKEKGDKK